MQQNYEQPATAQGAPESAAYAHEHQPLAPINTASTTGEPLPAAGNGPMSAGPASASSVPASMSAKHAKSLHKELEKEMKHEDSSIKKQVKEISHVRCSVLALR
jgi:hypothetical protein